MNGRIVILDVHDAIELERKAAAAKTVEELRIVVAVLIEKIHNGANGGHHVIDEDEA